MLERNTNKAWVGGVAAGLAENSGSNLVIIRILFVLGFLLGGFGLAVYAWLWFKSPESDPGQIHMNFQS